MVVTRTLAWEREGRRLVAGVDADALWHAAGWFFPDLRVEAGLQPDGLADPRTGVLDLHLAERPGTGGRDGFALHVVNPIPGGTASGTFDSAAGALRAFELALAEWAALGTSDPLRLHASGVVIDGGTVLLVGPSGSGKSTLVAALGQRGHPLLGDDMVPIDRETRLAAAFPRLVKLEGKGARLLGAPPPRGPGAAFWPDVSLLHPDDLGSRWGEPAPVRTILFPRRGSVEPGPRFDGPARTTIDAIAPSTALGILLRERVFPGNAARDFHLLTDLLNAAELAGVFTYDDAPEGAARIERAVRG